MPTLQATHRTRARFLRKVSSSTTLTSTLRKAVRILAEAGIPSLVVGGYAVQEHGYPRFTSDIDLVVPSVAAARERLTLNGFRENPGSSMTVTDRTSKIEIDLLPGGGSVGPGPLSLPLPTEVSPQPTLVTLRTLLEIKLSSYLGSPITRARDLGDVVELIKSNNLPADYPIDPAVSDKYLEVHRGLEAEATRAI